MGMSWFGKFAPSIHAGQQSTEAFALHVCGSSHICWACRGGSISPRLPSSNNGPSAALGCKHSSLESISKRPVLLREPVPMADSGRAGRTWLAALHKYTAWIYSGYSSTDLKVGLQVTLVDARVCPFPPLERRLSRALPGRCALLVAHKSYAYYMYAS